MALDWPLMTNNITEDDLEEVIKFLKKNPILTQSTNVKEFEKEWSQWLGVKYSVFVNSGSSANLLTFSALKQTLGLGEVIVPTLTWVSDITSVVQTGFQPVFVDIDPRTLSMNTSEVLKKINKNTKAVFLTHVQGFNGLSNDLLNRLKDENIALIEDVCESHGATFENQKLGSFGSVSNFSFYFAHHMSTIEGGMVCTNDENIYQTCRIIRSHGMVREATNVKLKDDYARENPELNPDFIFAFPAFNMRNNEIGAVIGRNQLKRLDNNILKRNKNFKLFLENLDSNKFFTDFELKGSSNYAFNLVLKKADPEFFERVMRVLRENKVEFRKGSSGGGNQLRQPYLREIVPTDEHKKYPNVEHIHFYSVYFGNYPDLSEDKILKLCTILNSL